MIDKQAPKKINKAVFQPFNVNRTHCFGIRSTEMLRTVYKHLNRNDWHKAQHIDHHLGRLHQQRSRRIYCPWEWLVGQAEGQSNISGRTPPERFWAPAEQLESFDPKSTPLVAVLGLHASGSSAMAGVLYHLGLHLGNELLGYWGKDPDQNCGFEAVGLMAICQEAIPFPTTKLAIPKGQLWAKLKAFINEKRREAFFKGTTAAIKYPQLCRCGDQLRNICGDQLRVVHIKRPLAHSIKSMVNRADVKEDPKCSDETVEAHQRWLWEGKEELIESLPSKQVLTVNFETLLSHPRVVVTKLKKFLKLKPTKEQVDKAVAYVKPDLPQYRKGKR